MLHLERTVGGLDHFRPYIKDYIKTFNGHSITTSQWKEHLFDFFGKQENGAEYVRKLGKVDFDEVSSNPLYNRCAQLTPDTSGCTGKVLTSASTCSMTKRSRSL